jgi:hypothetical protein
MTLLDLDTSAPYLRPLVFKRQYMQATAEMFPIWDAYTRAQKLDENKQPLFLDEITIRRYISRGMMTICRGRGNSRTVVWKGARNETINPFTGKPVATSALRIPAPQKYCVPESVGDVYRVFRHVAHRCSAAQPDREPVNADWL